MYEIFKFAFWSKHVWFTLSERPVLCRTAVNLLVLFMVYGDYEVFPVSLSVQFPFSLDADYRILDVT